MKRIPLALVALLVVTQLLAFTQPARADTDLAAGATVLSFGGNYSTGPTNTANVVDGDLATDAYWSHGAQGLFGAYVTITFPGGSTSWTSFRVKWDFPIYSAFPQQVQVKCGTNTGTTMWTSPGATGSSGSRDARDSGRMDQGTVCTSDKITVLWGAYGVGDLYHLYEVSAWVDPGAAFTDYVYNLRAAHPPFARTYRWNWAKTFYGTYTFTDSSANVKATRTATFVAGDEEPQPPQPPVTIQCIPVCGHDTYTLTVQDLDAGITVSYTIDSDSDGQLIADVVPPVLTGATFCYQKTTAQCANIDTTALHTDAGAVWVRYNFTGDAATNYYVELCERALELLPPACWPYTGTTGGTAEYHTPGTYTNYFDHDTAHDTDQVVLSVRDTAGHVSYLMSGKLDFGNGGSVSVTQQVPITPTSTIVCDQLDVLCGIRALFSLAPGVILAGFDTVMTPLKAKQPFATILGSAPTILAQLQRATDAVTTTSTCSGVSMVVPLGMSLPTAPPVNGHVMPTPPVAPSSIPAGPGRTAGPFTVTVLDCSTFESIVSGWSWFPTFRSFLGIAVYAAYGYSQLQRWQPRPQMAA